MSILDMSDHLIAWRRPWLIAPMSLLREAVLRSGFWLTCSCFTSCELSESALQKKLVCSKSKIYFFSSCWIGNLMNWIFKALQARCHWSRCRDFTTLFTKVDTESLRNGHAWASYSALYSCMLLFHSRAHLLTCAHAQACSVCGCNERPFACFSSRRFQSISWG